MYWYIQNTFPTRDISDQINSWWLLSKMDRYLLVFLNVLVFYLSHLNLLPWFICISYLFSLALYLFFSFPAQICENSSYTHKRLWTTELVVGQRESTSEGEDCWCSGVVIFACSLKTLMCSLVVYKEIPGHSLLALFNTPAGACNGSWHGRA